SHLAQRPDRDAGTVHGQDEGRDAGMLGHFGVAPGQEVTPVRVMGARGPHLLAADHPVVTVGYGAGPEAGQIAPGLRFAEELTPDLVPGKDQRQMGQLLLTSMGPD